MRQRINVEIYEKSVFSKRNDFKAQHFHQIFILVIQIQYIRIF